MDRFSSRQLYQLYLDWEQLQFLRQEMTPISFEIQNPVTYKNRLIPTSYKVVMKIRSIAQEDSSQDDFNTKFANLFVFQVNVLSQYPDIAPECLARPIPFHPHFQKKSDYGLWIDYHHGYDGMGRLLLRIAHSLQYDYDYIVENAANIGNYSALMRYKELKQESPHIFPTDKTPLPSELIMKQKKTVNSVAKSAEKTKALLLKKQENIMKNGNQKKKILFLGANPLDTTRLRIDEEIRRIDDGLQAAKYRDHYELVSKWAIKLETLTKALLDSEPQIIHFSGHGSKNGIAIEDDNGVTQTISAAALKKIFGLFKDKIECVILNSCYSMDQARAISENSVYVIGMNESINDKAAIDFAVGFYQSVGAGKDYLFAYQMGLAITVANGTSQTNIPEIWKDGEQIKL